ncbi:MAG: TorF family putative porin [Sulfurimonas sp.]|nr:TorF family putative porin [Sulfurimonas sp.]
MKSIKLSLVAALVVTGTTTLSADFLSEVETSANVALTSNYVWRGFTQTDDNPAIQGGFDIGYKGLYAGVWGSNVDFGDDYDTSVEIDLYLGYANEISGLTYDVNYCQYTYPGETDELNFGEASLTLGYDFEVVALSAKYYLGVDTNDVNNDDDWEPENGWEVGASVPLPMDITLDAIYGDYGSGEDSIGEYYLIGATKSFEKFDISVAYTGMDFDDNDAWGKDQGNLVVTLGASF